MPRSLALREINIDMSIGNPEPHMIVKKQFLPELDFDKELDKLLSSFSQNISSLIERKDRLITPTIEKYRIEIKSIDHPVKVGNPSPFAYREAIRKRLYNEERQRLARGLVFKQYGMSNCEDAEHQQALCDIRTLLERHGQRGAWLWDPFIDYQDIINTLFFCPYHGVVLRALGSYKNVKNNPTGKPESFEDWLCQQRSGFTEPGNNYYGLHLEFREQYGTQGWPFHDRFLIFPRSDEASLAWSLGCSVNKMGEHHILQQVTNGQMIADAFDELWDVLDDDTHRVWKWPQ